MLRTTLTMEIYPVSLLPPCVTKSSIFAPCLGRSISSWDLEHCMLRYQYWVYGNTMFVSVYTRSILFLKTVDSIGNCQRTVFSRGVSQHMHTITNL